MQRCVADLARSEHDLVIVGGGAFGACAAWEAVSRGLSVALIEKDDFCQATSANHLKIVHGGIRYLQHLDIRRVRESSRECSALLSIAPHLVQPLPIVMPTYGHGAEGRLVLGAGLKVYDRVTKHRNEGIADPDRRRPASRLLSKARCIELCPPLNSPDLTGGGLFYDGQFYNPSRLVLAFLRSACMAGARIANYVEATGLLRDGRHVCGVRARDVLNGDSFDVRGRALLNATGPWAAEFLERGAQLRLQPRPVFSRDAGFAVRGRRFGDVALACRVRTRDPDAILNRKGRHVFVAPWRDYTLFGSWHKLHTSHPGDVGVSADELQSFLDEINAARIAPGLRYEDVSMVYAGLTLFAENRPGEENLRFGHRSLLVDHAVEHGVHGLVTLIGVRATMARGMAEKAVDLVLRKLDRSPRASQTDTIALIGGDTGPFEAFVSATTARWRGVCSDRVLRSLAHNHGSNCNEILEWTRADKTLSETIGRSTTLKAEVLYALRNEMAQTLADVVFRRTELASGGTPGDRALQQCADLMAAELGWDQERLQRELELVRRQLLHQKGH